MSIIRPLAPFRVIDRSATVAGRHAARLLAALGPEVVRGGEDETGGDDALLGRGGWRGLTLAERRAQADAIEGALADWAACRPVWDAAGFWIELARAHPGRCRSGVVLESVEA